MFSLSKTKFYFYNQKAIKASQNAQESTNRHAKVR